jgi:hypothetical protein
MIAVGVSEVNVLEVLIDVITLPTHLPVKGVTVVMPLSVHFESSYTISVTAVALAVMIR